MMLRSLPLIFDLFVRRIAAQTARSTPSVTPIRINNTLQDGCNGCSLAPAFTDTTIYNATATREMSFLLFTGYNIASQYMSSGQCQFELGTNVPVSPAFSISQPATINSAEFQSAAKDSFINHLGFSSCFNLTAVVTTVLGRPTGSAPSPLSPATSVSNEASTKSTPTRAGGQNPSPTHSSPTPSSGSPSKKVEVANAVTFPVVFLGLVIVGFLLYRCRKKQSISTRKEEDSTAQNPTSPQEKEDPPQPYLQQKAELEAEERRKHELEARERRWEIGTEGERYELPGGEGNLMWRSRQELRGEEHSRELDVCP